MTDQEIIENPIFKRIVEKMQEMEDYKKIAIFNKSPRDKAEIIRKCFSSAFIDTLNNEIEIDFPDWPSLEEYLENVFELENLSEEQTKEATTEPRSKASELTVPENGSLKKKYAVLHPPIKPHGSAAIDLKLKENEEEFTGTIIIPEEKSETKDSIIERKSPITPGVTEVAYITREEREKQLRDEYRKKVEEERLKNLTPGMNR